MEGYTNSSGAVSLDLPAAVNLKFRAEVDGVRYYTDLITLTAHQENQVDMALDLLALTKNPEKGRILFGRGKKKEPILLASIGSLAGLLANTAQTQIPGEVIYFINDHFGTPAKVVDDDGVAVWDADYLPFGDTNVLTDTYDNKFRFPGQYLDDESGWHYNCYRYYAPGMGRYFRGDPIGLAAGINLFYYALNNPVNLIDFFGLDVHQRKKRGLDDPIFNIFRPTDFSGPIDNWGVKKYCDSTSKIIGACADWAAIKGQIVAVVGSVAVSPPIAAAGDIVPSISTVVSVSNTVLTVTVCMKFKTSAFTTIVAARVSGWLGAAISAIDGVLNTIGQ